MWYSGRSRWQVTELSACYTQEGSEYCLPGSWPSLSLPLLPFSACLSSLFPTHFLPQGQPFSIICLFPEISAPQGISEEALVPHRPLKLGSLETAPTRRLLKGCPEGMKGAGVPGRDQLSPDPTLGPNTAWQGQCQVLMSQGGGSSPQHPWPWVFSCGASAAYIPAVGTLLLAGT